MRAIKSILIVEDLVEVAQWMRHQVETLLVAERIDEACNLAAARECIAARRHDLLMVDRTSDGLPFHRRTTSSPLWISECLPPQKKQTATGARIAVVPKSAGKHYLLLSVLQYS